MNQLCKVCAEPAAGFHFGAFTCEGCKSFFGRTYNNLSQIHECKNGGQCVINKQNRTSCKACRLRKCLVVGMSKTGSRYGRRSNWFKTICLLQEQCAYNNPASAPSFRSPVTPTLQDGSLPFVNSQLRDALHTMEVPMGSLKQGGLRVPISSPHSVGGVPTVPSCSVGGAGGGTCSRSEPTEMAASFALGHMEAVERQLQEEALKSLKRDTGLTGSDLEATYREHLLEALRRSHGDHEARQFDGSTLPSMRRAINDSEHIGRVKAEFARDRRTSPDNDNTILTSVPPFGWDQRLSEASLVYSESEAIKSTSSCASQVSLTISVSTARHSDCPTTCSPIRLEPMRNNYEVIDNKTLTAGSNLCSTSGNRSPSRMTPKNEVNSVRLHDESEVPMTEEERLSFLKNASKISSNNCVSIDANRTNNFQGIPIIPPRLSPRDDILYGPMNNNIFPFPSYPPVWPSILPFPAFARFYPPFPAPAIPGSPAPFDGFKNPAYLPPELRSTILSKQAYELPKVDPTNKKRILDAILQVQRENAVSARSPPRGMSPSGVSVPRCLPIQITSSSAVIPVVTSAATIVASAVMGDQPIDLTVRRKRKMAKSEIMYQPKDGLEHDMQSGFEREVVDEERQREEREAREKEEALTDASMTKEIFVQGKSEIVDLKSGLECASSLVDNKFEVPLKIIKLETAGDTLIA